MKNPWNEDESFRFTILMGLRKGFRIVKGMRRQLDEREQKAIASAIAEHIKLANWEVRQKPPNKSL